MEIDVIIPLYKPGKELFTLLDKLGSQSVPVHQVILLNTEEKYFEQLIYGIRFLETGGTPAGGSGGGLCETAAQRGFDTGGELYQRI